VQVTRGGGKQTGDQVATAEDQGRNGLKRQESAFRHQEQFDAPIEKTAATEIRIRLSPTIAADTSKAASI
jgi:hypothetical protein